MIKAGAVPPARDTTIPTYAMVCGLAAQLAVLVIAVGTTRAAATHSEAPISDAQGPEAPMTAVACFSYSLRTSRQSPPPTAETRASAFGRNERSLTDERRPELHV